MRIETYLCVICTLGVASPCARTRPEAGPPPKLRPTEPVCTLCAALLPAALLLRRRFSDPVNLSTEACPPSRPSSLRWPYRWRAWTPHAPVTTTFPATGAAGLSPTRRVRPKATRPAVLVRRTLPTLARPS